MRTPEQSYMVDPIYRGMVDMLEHTIDQHHLAPSEMREMVHLACVRYEMHRPRRYYVTPESEGVMG